MHSRNQYDVELENLHRKMANGGPMPSGYVLETPTGKPTKLSYIEQVLVRTSVFKNWFGDWQAAAKKMISRGSYPLDGDLDMPNWFANESYIRIMDLDFDDYKGVSKIIDINTLEPRLMYHGTPQNEFFEFNVTKTDQGRPYGYFAANREYSEGNFARGSSPTLYKVFLNIKKPLIFNHYAPVPKENVKETLAKSIVFSGVTEKDTKFIETYDPIDNYIRDTYPENGSIWMLMARDMKRVFKQMILSLNFDGIVYGEEFRDFSDVNNPREFTRAAVIFYPNQVKLADGRNTDFNMDKNDIRYAQGGMMNEMDIKLPDTSSRYSHLKDVLALQGYKLEKDDMYERGGDVKTKHGVTSDAKKGGYFDGRSHAEGGIKAHNVDTDSPIEVEGGEVIITKKAVSDNTKREFEGEMLTNREILSKINQSGGGVSFENGGQVSEHMAKHGMELSKNKAKYGHYLVRKMKIGGLL